MYNVFKLTLCVLVASAAPVAAKTIVFCSEASPPTFNPQLTGDSASADAAGQTIYNRLVQFKPGTTEVAPALAESWDVSADGKTYTFHLRRGVKFHSNKYFKPSRDFNADDVVFTISRPWQADHSYHSVGGGTYEYFSGMGFAKLLKDVRKIDDYTVRIELNYPDAPLLANLATEFIDPIMSAEYAAAMMKAGTPDRVDQNPIGTGPWVFAGYQKDAYIRYTANKQYWKHGFPKEDRLVFAITPDASVRYAKLKAGECHVMPFPNPADLKAMASDPDIKLMRAAGANTGYLDFNSEIKPFDDPRVRRALSMAVDKQAILSAIYQGSAVEAKGLLPPTIWSYNDQLVPPPYDPEGAKALLKKAGLGQGFKTELWAMPVQRPYNPNSRRMAEMVQADWKKIGVDAKIVSYEWGEYLDRLRDGEAPTFFIGWTTDNGDPDNFLYVLRSCESAHGGSNYGQYCDRKEFEPLVVEAKRIPDQGRRAELYKKAQAVLDEQSAMLPIAHAQLVVPMRKEVKGYVVDIMDRHNFEAVTLK